MKFMSSYWSKLGINRKFSMIFVVLFMLIVFMAISAWLSFISIRYAEDDIRRSTRIGHQVLEMDRGLERARRLLDDFFLTYKSIGLQTAHVQYAQPSVRQISKVISLSSDLEKQLFHSQIKATSNIDPTDINLYLASAKRFADTSIIAVELISKRAAPEWGLETRMEEILVDLNDKLSEVQSLARLQNQVVILYKDYQMRGQRPLMQSVFNTQSIIKSLILESPQFASAAIDHIVGQIDQFQILANELLNLDREILSKMNDFHLQEVGIRPISSALVEAARQEVVKTQRDVDKVYKTAGFLLITFAVMSLLIMLFVAKILRQTITNNIIKLASSAQEFGQGNMEIRLEETSKDELGQLAKVFNEMADKLQDLISNLEEQVATRTAELAQSQKVEAIGRLAGGIAHDFNNILMAIVGYSELAAGSIAEGHPARDDIREILRSAERAAALVKQILTYSRKQEHQLKRTDPYSIVKEALQMLKPSIPATIEIIEDLDEKSGEIMADPTNIHQILINLCTNALHAILDQKGTITIRLYSTNALPDNTVVDSISSLYSSYVVLSVVDTGHGMEPSTLQRIFDPYFTTKEVGKGSGMGLAVVHGIVQELHGKIDVDSEPGKGTTISVYIPRIAPTDSTIGSIADVPQPNFIHEHHVKQVLVVDDEPLLVKLHKRQLERIGYTVTTATDSTEALRRFTESPQSFDLLITDQTMPGLSGAELSRAILSLRPDLPIIMCTGHSDIVSEDDALSFGIRKYVLKPIQGNELLEAVQEVTGTASTMSA